MYRKQSEDKKKTLVEFFIFNIRIQIHDIHHWNNDFGLNATYKHPTFSHGVQFTISRVAGNFSSFLKPSLKACPESVRSLTLHR